MAVDWYGVIEPRRVAEVALTPGGLSGEDDDLDSPPASGEEEGWLSRHLQRLRDLVNRAATSIQDAKGEGKQRLSHALGNIRASARKAKATVLNLFPSRKDLVDGFNRVFKASTKLMWAEKAAQGAALLALLWLADRYA